MNGFGTIDKKDINVLISSIENKINFIRNDINQNVTSLKNQLNACTEELNRLKKLVIQVTNYNDTEYKKIENRINEFAKDIEDIKSNLNTIQYNEIAAGKCASGINEYPIYAKYAENDTNGNIIPEYYAAKFDLSNVSSTLSADYTEKIAESSSGGMSALSSVSAQLHDSIVKETNTLKSKDEELKSSIDNESTERISKDNELDDKIEKEISNRKNEISGLQNLLKKEISRATEVEQGISESLSKEIEDRTNAITELEGKIASEETRAIKAEQSLQTSIVNETSRATEVENELLTNLNCEIKRATDIETGLRTDLDKEISRATESETTIKTTLQENIDKEVTRAKGVENELQSNIDSEATLRVSAYNEIKTNLSDEITRATGVETTLTNNLKSEISRALSAELQLDTKIDTNTNKIYDTISSISGHLSSSIISEYNDRVAADISLQNQIDTIEATQNVIDLVANYAALTGYDTTNVKVNDKIQVICDETSANQTTIYSWNNNTWNGIGMFGPYYTKSQVEEEITKAINTEKTERESDIEELNTNKQNNLTACAGIDLTNDTISVNTDIIATKKSVDEVKTYLNNLTGKVDNHTTQIEHIQEDIAGIESSLTNKKDKQPTKTFTGSATKTIKNISQNANGELTVEFEYIDLPQEVPNVEITSEDKSIQVTETTDVQTNTKKFDLSVNVNDPLEFGQFRATNITSQAQLTKINGNLELNSYAIKLKKGNSYHFTVRGSYVANNTVNTNSTIVYIEPISFNNINVNVDNTITDAQFFEISYDVYKLSSDKNYNVAFSSMSDGKVSELWVEVHNLNGISVNGQGGGSGTTYTAGDAIDINNNNISVKYSKGLKVNDSNQLEINAGRGLTFDDNRSLEFDCVSIAGTGIYYTADGKLTTVEPESNFIDITDEWQFLNGFRLQYNDQFPGYGNDMRILYSPVSDTVKFTSACRINRTSTIVNGWNTMLQYKGNRFYTTHNAPNNKLAPSVGVTPVLGGVQFVIGTNNLGATSTALLKFSYIGSPIDKEDDCGLAISPFLGNNSSIYGCILQSLILKVHKKI